MENATLRYLHLQSQMWWEDWRCCSLSSPPRIRKASAKGWASVQAMAILDLQWASRSANSAVLRDFYKRIPGVVKKVLRSAEKFSEQFPSLRYPSSKKLWRQVFVSQAKVSVVCMVQGKLEHAEVHASRSIEERNPDCLIASCQFCRLKLVVSFFHGPRPLVRIQSGNSSPWNSVTSHLWTLKLRPSLTFPYCREPLHTFADFSEKPVSPGGNWGNQRLKVCALEEIEESTGGNHDRPTPETTLFLQFLCLFLVFRRNAWNSDIKGYTSLLQVRRLWSEPSKLFVFLDPFSSSNPTIRAPPAYKSR